MTSLCIDRIFCEAPSDANARTTDSFACRTLNFTRFLSSAVTGSATRPASCHDLFAEQAGCPSSPHLISSYRWGAAPPTNVFTGDRSENAGNQSARQRHCQFLREFCDCWHFACRGLCAFRARPYVCRVTGLCGTRNFGSDKSKFLLAHGNRGGSHEIFDCWKRSSKCWY